jgi:polyisoprenoid-binding protein YceI
MAPSLSMQIGVITPSSRVDTLCAGPRTVTHARLGTTSSRWGDFTDSAGQVLPFPPFVRARFGWRERRSALLVADPEDGTWLRRRVVQRDRVKSVRQVDDLPRTLARAATLAGLLAIAVGAGPAQVPAYAASQGVARYVIDPSASQVLYHVAETFIDQNNRFNVAVATTHGIQGEILIDRGHPRQSRLSPIIVDISQFTSNSRRRDNAIRERWLESAKYPTAVFTPTAIQGLPDAYADGREIAVQVAGNLKVRDVTKPVTFAATIKLEGDTVTGHATTSILMTDFGFDPPSILGVLKAENQAQLELELIARRLP